MVDSKAFRAMSYGVYIVSAQDGNKRAGCVVNTLTQVTSKPAQVSVAVNKDNVTADVIRAAGRFEAAILTQDAPMELIGRFGFHSSADMDKFAETAHAVDEAGMPYVTEHAVAHIGARVVATLDVGSHILFIGEVEEAEVISDDEPLTYAYYHQVKGGKTPPKASSYEGDAEPTAETSGGTAATRTAWRCKVCGYVIEADELPADFTCPVCGMGRDAFERIEVPV